MMGLGALLTAMAFRGGLIPTMVSVSGAGFKYAVVIIIVASTVMANCLNLYSGGMSSLTWDFPLPRWVTVAIIGVLSIVLALAFGGNQFTHYYDEILYFVAYFTSPWYAVIFLHFFYFEARLAQDRCRCLEFLRQTWSVWWDRVACDHFLLCWLRCVRTVHGNDSLHRSDWEYACRHRLELFCELHSDWCGVFLLGAPTSLT